MNVLMTGGYGCIGSWVAKRLIDAGGSVHIFDLREDTHRLDLLLEPDQRDFANFVPGDVSDAKAVRDAVEETGATHILHLAGLQVPTCRTDPMLGAKVNVLGTIAVFEAAATLKHQVKRVVYASSAAVHGPSSSDQTIADEVRLSPVTHYGAFKVCNELNARVYWLDHGVSSVGLRPWTVYGVGRDFGVTSEPTKAIQEVACGRSYAISYGGVQDLQYVDDVAALFLKTLFDPFQGAEAYNVRGDVIPIETFVSTLESAVPEAKGKVMHGERQLPIAPNLDDSRLEAQFGPLPRTSLAQGIAETYRRFAELHRGRRI